MQVNNPIHLHLPKISLQDPREYFVGGDRYDGDCYQDQDAKRLKNSGSNLDWNFSNPPLFFLLIDVPIRCRCIVAAGSRSLLVTFMKESSSTLCMSLSASVDDFFLKSLEDLDEPGLTSGLTSSTECISMLFWYLSVLLLRGRISSPLAALGASCLALQILLLGVMNTSRLRATSDGFPPEGSFLLLMENSRQLYSMSRGGAGSMAESFLRRVEAALRFILCYGSLILFTTFEDCILQLLIQTNAAHLFRKGTYRGLKFCVCEGAKGWMHEENYNLDVDNYYQSETQNNMRKLEQECPISISIVNCQMI